LAEKNNNGHAFHSKNENGAAPRDAPMKVADSAPQCNTFKCGRAGESKTFSLSMVGATREIMIFLSNRMKMKAQHPTAAANKKVVSSFSLKNLLLVVSSDSAAAKVKVSGRPSRQPLCNARRKVESNGLKVRCSVASR
jgi:hypothetical protein